MYLLILYETCCLIRFDWIGTNLELCSVVLFWVKWAQCLVSQVQSAEIFPHCWMRLHKCQVVIIVWSVFRCLKPLEKEIRNLEGPHLLTEPVWSQDKRFWEIPNVFFNNFSLAHSVQQFWQLFSLITHKYPITSLARIWTRTIHACVHNNKNMHGWNKENTKVFVLGSLLGSQVKSSVVKVSEASLPPDSPCWRVKGQQRGRRSW